ncbi:MAG: biopolymer transporter ExbD, partial [Planctomycetaceae bacterium]
IAQEDVQGQNLQSYLANEGRPSLPQCLHIIKCVATALQTAVEGGVVHRDIKPDNILITHKGEIKVTDFGLAQLAQGDHDLNLTQVGTTLGTPMYMSPEQVKGSRIDHRSDIYSLGVTCYHMLAGSPPFTGDSPIAVAMKQVNEDPEPLKKKRPELPTALCTMVHKMMSKSVDGRYQNAVALLRDLKQVTEKLAARNSGKSPAAEPTRRESKRALKPTDPVASDRSVASQTMGRAGAPLGSGPAWMSGASQDPAGPSARERALSEAKQVDDDDDEGFTLRAPTTEFDEMDLTPMVDVTFLLLIFFMITASFSIQKTIQVPPPDPEKQGAAQSIQSLEDLEADAIIVEIDEDNAIVVDDEPVADPTTLAQLFEQKMTAEQKNELVVEAAAAALHDTVVQVIDAANDVNIQRIRLVTRTGE